MEYGNGADMEFGNEMGMENGSEKQWNGTRGEAQEGMRLNGNLRLEMDSGMEREQRQ